MTQHDERHHHIGSAGAPEPPPGAAEVISAARGDGAGLDPGEEHELWRGRTSWKHFADVIAVAFGWSLIALIIALSGPRWLGWTMAVISAGGWVYTLGCVAHGVLSRYYRLTTQRLFIERGLLSKTIDQTELIRVDDVRIRKSLLDRMMGLGCLEVLSTDQSDRRTELRGIVQPERVADLIRQHMRRLRRSSLFVENI